jgi:hypothetical protein
MLASIAGTTTGSEPDRMLNSLTLLDMAAFAYAVILYDHVVVLPGASLEAEVLNRALGEPVITPLQVPLETDLHNGLLGIGAILGCLFESVLSELAEVREAGAGSAVAADLDAITDSWSILLERELWREDVLASWSNEWSDWNSDGPGLLSRLLAIQSVPTREGYTGELEMAARLHDDDDDDELAFFVSESNHRGYFNLRLSYMLGVPYIGSITRVPFRHQLYRNAAFAHHQLLLHREIDRYADRSVYQPDKQMMTVPAFLAVALNRASAPSDVLTQIAELRDAATGLRGRRAEWEQALQQRDTKHVRRLRSAIAADAVALRREVVGPVATAVSASLAAAASPTTGLTIALVGILSCIGSMPEERREAIARRLLRPSEWFLTSTCDTARSIGSAREDVARLWSLNDETINWIVERMHSLSRLPPA